MKAVANSKRAEFICGHHLVERVAESEILCKKSQALWEAHPPWDKVR